MLLNFIMLFFSIILAICVILEVAGLFLKFFIKKYELKLTYRQQEIIKRSNEVINFTINESIVGLFLLYLIKTTNMFVEGNAFHSLVLILLGILGYFVIALLIAYVVVMFIKKKNNK